MVHGIGPVIAKFRYALEDNSRLLTLTVGVDATCLVQAYQVSVSEDVVVGGAAPNHTLDIPENSSKKEVKALLKVCGDDK